MGVRVVDNDRLFVRMQQQTSKLDGSSVDVGFPDKAAGIKSPLGTSVAEYMTYLHEGIDTVSGKKAWPFFDVAILQQQERFDRLIAQQYARIQDGRATARQLWTRVGIEASNEVKKAIVQMREPALEPSTVAKKGSSNPLVDLGIALNAVTWQVNQ